MEKKKKIFINQQRNVPVPRPVRFTKDLLIPITRNDSVLFQSVFQRFDRQKLLESRDCKGASLLHVAAAHSNKDIVEYLIRSGFHVNLQDEHGQTALMVALKKNYFANAKVLLESDADVRICDTLGICALRIVIAADLATSDNPEPPFYPHRVSEYWKIVSLIVNKINEDYSFDSKKIAHQLLRIRCPLSHVVFMGNWKVMKIMIEKGSPINARDRYSGRTALHLAVEYWKLDEIKLLLSYGADLNVRDHYKKTPCMCVYDDIKNMQMSPSREIEIVKAILEHKHKVFVTNDYGLGVLDQMSQIFQKGSADAVRAVIMESDDDLFLAKNKDKFTLLHLLAENSNPGIVEIIKGRKVDLNSKSKYKETALGHAIHHDNYEMIEYLLSEGATTDAENLNRSTSRRTFTIHEPYVQPHSLKRLVQCTRLLLEKGVDQEVLVRNRSSTVTMLGLALSNEGFPFVQPILAQLAIRKILEVPIPECFSERIQLYDPAKTYFDSCVKQLDVAKTSKIIKSLSVFEFLTASDKSISHWARDRNLVLNLSKWIDQSYFSDSYYAELLRKCFLKISSAAESRDKAEEIICQTIGKFYECNYIVTRIIVDFLDDKNIKRLL